MGEQQFQNEEDIVRTQDVCNELMALFPAMHVEMLGEHSKLNARGYNRQSGDQMLAACITCRTISWFKWPTIFVFENVIEAVQPEKCLLRALIIRTIDGQLHALDLDADLSMYPTKMIGRGDTRPGELYAKEPGKEVPRFRFRKILKYGGIHPHLI